jgi:hypothetical protein
MRGQSIQRSLSPWALWARPKPRAPKPLRLQPSTYSTIVLRIPTPAYVIKPVTWCCTSIATPLTFPSQKLAVALEDISSSATAPLIYPNHRSRHPLPLHTSSVILRNVMASAAEAKIGALFVNAQDGTVLLTTLIELGHPQPPTPLQSDNSTAPGTVNASIRQRRSKAIDMRFYWDPDRVNQGHFLVYWRPGTENLADYFTKHHPTAHHRLVGNTFLHPTKAGARALFARSNVPHRSLRGCVVFSPPGCLQGYRLLGPITH